MFKAVLIFFTLGLMLYAPPAINDLVAPPAYAQNIPSPTPQAEDLNQLDILMGEHAIVGAEMLMARYSNQPHFSAARTAVNNNTSLLAETLANFYGEQEVSEFTTLWTRHVDYFIRYTDAKRNNDQNRQTESVRELQKFTQDMATLLSRGNREMYTIAQNYFSQHVLNEKRIIDEYADRDYTTMYRAMHDAYVHSTAMTEKLQ